MSIEILKDDFSIEVTGFDIDRDLYIKADAKENSDADQAN